MDKNTFSTLALDICTLQVEIESLFKNIISNNENKYKKWVNDCIKEAKKILKELEERESEK